MNPLPLLALGLITAGYAWAVEGIDERVAEKTPIIQSWPAAPGTDDPSVFEMPGMTADGSETLAYDQPHCEATDAMTANLDHDFAEKLVETRVTSQGLEIDLYASEIMGTWTVLHRGNDGISCIVSSGIGWTAAATPEMVLSQTDLAS